jgi:endo-alpha-1,4-polygalactosaminidase (GH114 family)
MLIEELIPPILAKGFDGILIDTMDSVVQPEIDDPIKYQGMKNAAIKLIKDVRAAYPNMKIMMNRGLEILPDVASDIDYVMAESVYTDWVPNPKKPVRVSKETNDYYLDLIKRSQAISPKLKVYSMEYWDMKDIKGVQQIYKDQRALGWVPYVSTMDLQHHTPEPQ